MQATEVSGEENLDIRVSPITTESAMKKGNGTIFELVRVLFKSLVLLVVLLFEGFVVSMQVPLDATVPLGQVVKQFP
jgi:hypothetical protein